MRKVKIFSTATLALLLLLPAGAEAERCSIRGDIIATAKKFLGTAYRYGGTGRRGFDCSGFVQHVFMQHGFKLPRITRDQYKMSRRVPLKSARPGDLLFFAINGKRISHVGIYLGRGRFIHSPRTGKRVRVASMKISYWKKRFAGAGTYIN